MASPLIIPGNASTVKVNVEGLTPVFDKSVKEYTLNVANDVDKIEVTAATEDEKSKFEIAGNEELKVGENTILVTVTAEDGTTTIYQIKVTKAAPEGLKLTKLEIKDYELSPKFKSEVFEYKLTVTKSDKLDIITEASEEKATVEIIGNTEFEDGDNLITIMVKSEDGTETVTYQITVTKKEAVVAVNENKDDNGLNKVIFLVGGLIVVVVIGIVAYLVINKKKANEEENDGYYSGTYDEEDENYDTIQNYDDEEDYYNSEDNFEDDNNDDDNDGKHF